MSTALKSYNNIVLKTNLNKKTPLIILFGWAGCNDRYLTKYSEIYENKK